MINGECGDGGGRDRVGDGTPGSTSSEVRRVWVSPSIASKNIVHAVRLPSPLFVASPESNVYSEPMNKKANVRTKTESNMHAQALQKKSNM